MHLLLVMHEQFNHIYTHHKDNWGERERAPHRPVGCGTCLYIIYIIYYIYIVCRAVSHLRLLFCASLRHSLIQKLFTNYSYWERRHQSTVRTETTRGPIYSMARTIGATAWQKGFIWRYHYLCCYSQWKSLVTWTDLSNGHIDEGYQERLAAETAQEREARQQHDRDRHSERSVRQKS